MQFLSKISDYLTAGTKFMGVLLGFSIFAELLFGNFLGNYSVVGNIVDSVSKFGDKGFVGLLAMLLIVGFINKEK